MRSRGTAAGGTGCRCRRRRRGCRRRWPRWGIDLELGPVCHRPASCRRGGFAANAVMAGAEPPASVVLAAVQAMLAPRYNLHGVLATTHPCAPLVIVNGADVAGDQLRHQLLRAGDAGQRH